MIKLFSMVFIFILFVTGCSGTGFDKRTTVVPNRVGISIGQQQFTEGGKPLPGISINATWELK